MSCFVRVDRLQFFPLQPPLCFPSIVNGHQNKACPQIQSPRMCSTFGVTTRGAFDSCLKTAPPLPALHHCIQQQSGICLHRFGYNLHCYKLAESATRPDSGSFIFSSPTNFMRKMSRADTHVILWLSHALIAALVPFSISAGTSSQCWHRVCCSRASGSHVLWETQHACQHSDRTLGARPIRNPELCRNQRGGAAVLPGGESLQRSSIM